MRVALFLAIPLCVWAQADLQALKNDLQALRTANTPTSKTALAKQVGSHIMLLAEKTHEPKWTTLQQLANGMVYALAGRAVEREDLDAMAGAIQRVMQSAGTSTIGFVETVEDFEKRLAKAGVAASRAHDVASALERVGKEVQGPEDTPVMKFPGRR